MKKKTIIPIIILLFLLSGSILTYNFLNKSNQSKEGSSADLRSSDSDSAVGMSDSVDNSSGEASSSYLETKSDNKIGESHSSLRVSANSGRAQAGDRFYIGKVLKDKNSSRNDGQPSGIMPHSSENDTAITPPVVPLIPPVIPPTPPIAPPTPPQPPINPPVTPPQTNDDKARRIIADLTTPNNANVAQFTNDDGQIRTVLWAKGITPPRLGANGDFRKIDESHGSNRFVTHTTNGYRSDFAKNGWYDTDKSPNSSLVDINLCFGAVASNQLHWWMNYHKDNIDKFLQKTNYTNTLPAAQKGTLRDLTTFLDSFKHPQDSRVFTMMKTYFGNNREGYYADPLIDMFINGHVPKANGGFNDPDWPHNFQLDARGGFFHRVFGTRNLTRRLTISTFNEFNYELKRALQNGETVGLIHITSGNATHIITGWGAEFDLDGNVTAVYVTDSDDQMAPENGMKRYGLKNINGKPALSNNVTNPRSGARIDQMSTLGLGEDVWKDFLNK